MSESAAPVYVTNGLVRLTGPQLVGTLTGLLLGALLAAIDQTIVGTAEPRIIASLQGFDRYPWVATIYLLTSTVSVPIFASLSDRYGRKPFFMIGATVFVGASALCGAAGEFTLAVGGMTLDGMGQLILFRGLQGIGGGMVVGILFTIVGDIFSPIERGRYQGLFAALWGIASIFGPTAGGWLTDHWSWRACFYVNLPFGAIALAAIYFEFPHMKPRSAHRELDWAGFATLIGWIVPLLLALTWATQYGWGSTRVAWLLVVSTAMLAALIYAESRASEPIIPLTFFRDPVIAVCSVAAFVLGIGMFGTIIYLPLFMQGVLGVSATQSGNLLTPLLMGVVVASAVCGQAISRTGEYKLLGIAGSLLVAVGMILFARMGAETSRLYVAIGMVIAGFGMGLLQPVYTLAVQNVAPRERMGAATSSTIFFRSIGSTVGVAAFGTVMLTRYHEEFTRTIPAVVPKVARPYFENPLLLMQVRPELEQRFRAVPGGGALLDRLMIGVKSALLHGLQQIFFWSAVIMSAAVLLHLVLKREPLRTRAPVDAPAAGAAH
ncbi:MAG TPA: MDR family MFS transporter [Vicinamibacterales bacterium]|nr:MDR family MFS transporter [Vicinamibacterales bacterium]